jgi:hypothetical protein
MGNPAVALNVDVKNPQNVPKNGDSNKNQNAPQNGNSNQNKNKHRPPFNRHDKNQHRDNNKDARDQNKKPDNEAQKNLNEQRLVKPVNKKAKVKKHHSFAVRNTNKVLGMVYIGAAVLVIIVGLRGLGTIVGDLSLVPQFLIDPATGKIDSDFVMFALILEFFMLILLSLVTFFTPLDDTPEEEKEKDTNVIPDQKALERFKAQIKEIKEYTETEMTVMKEYLDDFEEMSRRVNRIQAINVAALKKLSEVVEK